MNLLRRLFGWPASRPARQQREDGPGGLARRCQFEALEQRRMLDADPILAGGVYIENDSGSDAHPDTFEITFEGGAPDTRLTRVVISGDQGAPGHDRGDSIFDIADGGMGADHGWPFEIVSMEGIDSVNATVIDGGLTLVLEFEGFDAGEKLVFSIDTDEIEEWNPAETDLAKINEGIDPVNSGLEFQNSRFTATFAAPHFHDVTGEGFYRNVYTLDPKLNLPADNANGLPDRTDGVQVELRQTPLPICVSGTVYHDRDWDLTQDAGEEGIRDVGLALYKKNDAGAWVDTGHRAVTDANGDYTFGKDLNLTPGVYRVVETQPDDFEYSVGAKPGAVGGVGTGVAETPNIISEIEIPLGGTESVDNDFAEAKPASISGYVYHDVDDDGARDPGEKGIEGVEIRVTALSSLVPQNPITVFTDANGFYKVDVLPPGVYKVEEIVQPPAYFDGKDTAGTVNGVTVGAAFNERLDNVRLNSDNHGVEYNFGEVGPSEIRGRVGLTDRDGNCFINGAPHTPLEGVTLKLLNEQGQVIAETTTNARGEYAFTHLRAGVYTVVEVTPPGLIDGDEHVGRVNGAAVGAITGNDRISGIILRNDQRGVRYDFCEHPPASVCGYVYVDQDRDANFDAGESPIPGAVVKLLDANGAEVARTTTDDNGFYKFDGLAAGEYCVVEEQPAGYFDGDDTAGTVNGAVVGSAVNPGDKILNVTLLWGDQGVNYNFGEYTPSSISGRVHADVDGDCELDPGEAVLEGVTIQLLNERGEVIAETLTDDQGQYQFDNLPPGVYSVREIQPAGYFHGGQSAGSGGGDDSQRDLISGVNIGVGVTLVDYDFCEHPPSSIEGVVHVDPDRDCVLDPGETRLEGVTVELLNANNQVVATTTTDENGHYKFDNLPPGVYSVRETQPDGYFHGGQVAGSHGGDASQRDLIRAISIGPGQTLVNYNFCELPPSSISGRVHADLDGDCELDPGEAVLSGVKIELLNEDGEVLATTHTDANGEYSFEDLPPGVYTVRETQPAGYYHGGQQAGSGGGDDSQRDLISQITVGAGVNLVRYDFCEHPPGSIEGVVHADPDQDCQLDDGETRLQGVRVQLRDAAGAVVATTFTDENGHYKFDNLPPGVYSVREFQPDGYFHGGQVAGSHGGDDSARDLIRDIPLGPGQSLVNYNFCEIPPSEISGRVHADRDGDCEVDPGEPLLEGVKIELLNEAGEVIDTTFTDENGRYRFTNLPPGVYTVRETQPAGYFHGGQSAGSGGGDDSRADVISNIQLGAGVVLVDYDFCEQEPASIEGYVHTDPDRDCVFDANETPLAGVKIELLNAADEVVATTFTNAEGHYKFDNLAPGVYGVRETQPAGYFHGGQVAGSHGGDDSQADLIRLVRAGPAERLVNYNFCEYPPSRLEGYVHADPDQDCEFDSGEAPIEGVKIELLDGDGQVVAVTHTDAAGHYQFENLPPGVYTVRETQPKGWFHGGQRAGSGGGDDSRRDLISRVDVGVGVSLVNYNFCEIPPGSIAGVVHVDSDGDCVIDPGETLLEGVRVQLLNEDGEVISETLTDEQGRYKFDNLPPGLYSVREIQPEGWFHGGQIAGSGGGDDSQRDLIRGVQVRPGDHLVDYHFCEKPEARISGYVFQDGDALVTSDGELPDNLLDLRDGRLTPDDTRLAGVLLELRDGVTGEPIDASRALPGVYPPGPIQVRTNAAGYYEFTGLPAGVYAVFEVQPEGYQDFLDTPGDKGGFADNVNNPLSDAVRDALTDHRAQDVIVRIAVDAGEHARHNNFAEVVVVPPPPFIPPPRFTPPPPPPPAPALAALPASPLPLPEVFTAPPRTIFTTAGLALDYTWHLSVVDAGYPRGDVAASEFGPVTPVSVEDAEPGERVLWRADHLNQGQWLARYTRGAVGLQTHTLGLPGGVPLVGDFNGDGVDEIGVYYRGEWFVDLNGDGAWDENDLWARIGSKRVDEPVVGDWNGDGKDDIGIFGPIWARDPIALRHEPGLPDAENAPDKDRAKNTPPVPDEATNDERLLQRAARGQARADVIDHVFRFGTRGQKPLAADWNGDGVSSIGVFHNGLWRLDVDGDGRFTSADAEFQYGEAGDLPVVGDFNGDGVPEIGVFRKGAWYIDLDGDREMRAHEKAFELGGEGDLPIAGDFDGDGVDEPGIYRGGRR